MPNGSHEPYCLVTPVEARLLGLIAEGKTSAEIAGILGETPAQVRERLTDLAARLRAS